MSSITKHYCDVCNKETNNEGLISVKAEVNRYGGYQYQDDTHIGLSLYSDLCKPCALKIGVLKERPTKKNNNSTVTVEELKDKLYNAICAIVKLATPPHNCQ